MPQRHGRARAVTRTALAAVGALALSACGGGLSLPAASDPGRRATSSPAASARARASAAPPALGAPLRWGSCAGVGSAQHVGGDQCAVLAVPLDRSASAGPTLGLQLIRRPASSTGSRVGSLLINPGGPGGSTVKEFDDLVGQLSPALRARFDIVGFDPRGVDSSDPVRCLDDKGLDRLLASSPDPLTPAGLAELQSQARSFAAACEQHSGDRLPFVGTVDAAKDIDAIRAAVGDERLTYLGFSYGTLLGATYASLFPTRVRALALDGAVDPGLGPIQGSEVQARGFQQALESFLADCQQRGRRCAWAPGGDLLQRYRELTARIARSPLPTGDAARPLTPSLALTGVAAALYNRDSWTYLEQGLASADRGDGRVLLALSDFLNERDRDGHYSSLVPSNTAVSCRDESAPLGTQPYVDSYRRLLQSAPDFATLATSGITCAVWPARPSSPPPPLVVAGAPPLLVVGSTGDPATPFVEAQALTALLPGSVLLTRRGEGHTGYAASDCVRTAVDSYLLDRTLPAAGTVCGS